jgi:hypothetical protein
MISQDRDYEDILRDALRAAAESVEPASGGLERIRHRSHSRRSARSMLARAADWLRLYRIRLSVRLESFRWELSEHGIRHSATGAHRSGRTPAGNAAGRLGPAAAWLKPAFAVATVVAVVAIGMVTLNRVQQELFRPTDSVTSPGRHHASAAGTSLVPQGKGQAPVVNPGPVPAASATQRPITTTLPRGDCSPTPTHRGSPAPTRRAAASPTPSPTNTATATPSVTPSATSSPSASPTTGTDGGPATGSGNSAARATTDAMFAPDTGTPGSTCGGTTSTHKQKTASPQKTASTRKTTRPSPKTTPTTS